MEIMHFRNDDYEGFVKRTIESGFSEKVLEYPDGVLLRKPRTLQYIVVITNRQDHVTDATWYASSTSPEEDYKDECHCPTCRPTPKADPPEACTLPPNTKLCSRQIENQSLQRTKYTSAVFNRFLHVSHPSFLDSPTNRRYLCNSSGTRTNARKNTKKHFVSPP